MRKKMEKDTDVKDDEEYEKINLTYNRAKTELKAIAYLNTYATEIPFIKLTITASIEDWRNLENFYSKKPEAFHHEFYGQFINPANIKLRVKKPQGIQKRRKTIVDMIKRDAGWLHPFWSYWVRRPLKEWPKYLTSLIAMVEKTEKKEVLKTKRGKYNALELTHFCTEKKYSRVVKKYGLSLFNKEDLTNFYRIYIKGNYFSSKVKKDYIEGKTPDEVADLVYYPVLFDIFERFKVVSIHDEGSKRCRFSPLLSTSSIYLIE